MKAKRYKQLEEKTAEEETKNEDQPIPNATDIELNAISKNSKNMSGSVVVSHQGKNVMVAKSIFHDVQEMRKVMDIKNRKLPRKFGKTIILMYNSKNEPVLTIGPHFPLSVCLVVTIIILAVFFTISMKNDAYMLCMVGIGVVTLHLLTFLTTVLLNPGIPSTKVSESDITEVISKNLSW